jgi:citrate synthase
MEHAIQEKQKVFSHFKKEHSNAKLGEVTVGQVIGGMRSMPGLLYETSKLHNMDGITYRGKDLYTVRAQSPKAEGGSEPLPEAALWLLLTGEFPSTSELKEFLTEIFNRGQIPADIEALIKSFPKTMHPMTQLSMGVLACQPLSKFAKAYSDGIHKSKYWDPTFEDALDVCARVSRIAAIIFHNTYKDVNNIPKADPALDYGANYANMLGFKDKTFWELMRLYIVIHA